MQNIHPLFVHFPIALILSAFAMDSLAIIFKHPNLYIVGRWNLTLGFLSAIATVLTGLIAEHTVSKHSYEIHKLMETHGRIGVSVLGLSGALTLWRWLAPLETLSSRKGRFLFLAFLASLACLLLVGAYYGGKMVYEYNVGGNVPTVIINP